MLWAVLGSIGTILLILLAVVLAIAVALAIIAGIILVIVIVVRKITARAKPVGENADKTVGDEPINHTDDQN